MLSLLDKTRKRGVLALLDKYGMSPSRLVHVGANEGQEIKHYRHVEEALYIEPIPDVFARLQRKLTLPGHIAVQALCSDTEEIVDFNIASNGGQSSSILPFGRHAGVYPEIRYVDTVRMETRTLDSILDEHDFTPDFIVLDVQGTELKVLRGATSHLPRVEAIYTEVAEDALYEGGCTLDEIRGFLRPFGFRLRHLEINEKTWGDALFINASSR